MPVITVASHDHGKVRAFRAIFRVLNVLGCDYEVVPLPNGIDDSEGGVVSPRKNARMKAAYYGKRVGGLVVRDDTGFFIEALGNGPGIMANHWAMENNETLWEKTLRLMKGQENRRAFVESAICIYDGAKDDEIITVSRKIYGTITQTNYAPKEHFGYQGIFIPDGADVTYSQMDEETYLLTRFNSWTFAAFDALDVLRYLMRLMT